MLSKKYFTNAAKAFVSNRSFTDFTKNAYQDSVRVRSLKWPEGIIRAFMTTLSTNLPSFYEAYCKGLPNLLSFTWYVEEYLISDAMEPRCAFEDDATERDFDRIVFETKVNRISGLRDFRCHAEPCKYVVGEGKVKLEKNVRRFEAYLRPIVMRARSQASTAPTEAAFYHEMRGGSANTGGDSGLLYFGSSVRL